MGSKAMYLSKLNLLVLVFFFQQILINFKRTLIYLFLLVTNMWLVDLESLTSPSTSLLQDEVLFEVELIGKWTLIMGS